MKIDISKNGTEIINTNGCKSRGYFISININPTDCTAKEFSKKFRDEVFEEVDIYADICINIDNKEFTFSFNEFLKLMRIWKIIRKLNPILLKSQIKKLLTKMNFVKHTKVFVKKIGDVVKDFKKFLIFH